MLDDSPRQNISGSRSSGRRSNRRRVYEEEYVSYRDILHFLRRYWQVIAAVSVLGMVGGLFYALRAEPLYTARTQILIDPSVTQILRDNRTSGTEPSLDTAQVEGQIAVLRSEGLAASVVNKLDLIHDPEFQGSGKSLIGTLRAALGLDSASNESSDFVKSQTTINALLSSLDVRRVGLSYAIDISVTLHDPEKAARVANAVAEAYIQDQLKAKAAAAQQGSEWLEERIAELRSRLNVAARELELFKAGHNYRPARRDTDSKQLQQGGQGSGGPMASAGPSQAQDVGQSATRRDADVPANPGEVAPQKPVTLSELEATEESYRKIYEAYQQAFAEAVQRQSFSVSNARILTAATRPLSKSFPRTKLIIALGGLLGLLSGLGLCFMHSSFDDRVRSARQLRERTGLRCLTQIPRPVRYPAAALPKTAEQGKWTNQAQAEPTRYFLEAVDVPFSPFSGALKVLKTAIIHFRRKQPIRTVAITSSLPGEGKSTVACNLAALFATSGVKTLLIDADIHNFSLSREFAPQAEAGLIEVLKGYADPADCLLTIQGTGVDILPVAPTQLAPISYELLGSERMQELLTLLRRNYYMVIIDLPPLNPIIDSLAIVTLLDGVVLVAEWGKTPMELLTEATNILQTGQANILGAVLTKVDPALATVRWNKAWTYGYYPSPERGTQ